jgi:hypothetical protein
MKDRRPMDLEDLRWLLGMPVQGNSLLSVGYVYAPYVSKFLTPSIVLSDFTKRRGLATRYAKNLVSGYHEVFEHFPVKKVVR